jgi:hypothetical protein
VGTYIAGRSDGTVEVDKNLFKDFDLQDIDRVTLASKKGDVVLSFNGSKWTVNDQFDADASMIQILFATLQQAEPKRPVSSSIRDSVSRSLKENGVHVSLFSSGAKQIGFFAGGNERKSQAFFCLDDNDAIPYLMTIPGYRVFVSGIFEVPESDWKDKLVFGFNWRNFETLEAVFPESQDQGFTVSLQDNYFGIEGMAAVDTARLNQFLDDVSLLTAISFVDQPILGDSVSKPPAMIVITVKDIAQRTYTLELYKPSATGQNVPGLINGKQWAFFQLERVQPIVRKRAFFSE